MELEASDFKDWNKRVTGGKTVSVPKLRDIQVAKFERGSKLLQFKVSHNDTTFQSVDFLMKKVQKDIDQRVVQPKSRPKARGIPPSKKPQIVNEFCRLMPDTKKLLGNIFQLMKWQFILLQLKISQFIKKHTC